MTPLLLQLGWLAGLAALPLAQGRALPHGPIRTPPLFEPVHGVLPSHWDTRYEAVFALESGDIDSDGDIDALLSLGWFADWSNIHGVNSVYLNNAHALFSPVETMPFAHAKSTELALGDLDTDGDLDVLVPWDSMFGPGPDHLYLNDGRAGFSDASAGLAPVDGDAKIARFGDLEGDGDLDLFYARTFPSSPPFHRPVLHENEGGTTFSDLSGTLPAGTHFNDARFGDVDGDEDVDLVICAGSPSRALLWDNDGLGGLTDVSASQMPAGSLSASHFELGDLDADGDLDLGAFGLLLINDGQGTFAIGPIHSDGAGRPVALCDAENDGDLDLLGPTVLLVNDGAASFSSSFVPSRNCSFSGFEAGDFDSDGDPDALVSEQGEYLVTLPHRAEYLLFNDGAHVFTDSRELDLDAPLEFSAPARLGRIDADPHADLVAASIGGDSLTLRLGDGTGGFEPPLDLGTPPSEVELADTDGDGDTDLVLAASNGVRVIRNHQGIQFTDLATPIFWQTSLVELADVDGDLDLDVATAEFSVRHNRLLLNQGSNVFALASSVRFPPLAGTPTALAFLDVEPDGDADVAFAEGQVKLYRNDGTGSFLDVTASAIPGGSADLLAAGDVDGDGDPDLLVGTSNGLRLLENDGGTFADRSLPALGGPVQRLELLDLDLDGHLDALVHANRTLVLGNDGSGRFRVRQAPGESVLMFDYFPVVTGDVDGDGDPDLLREGEGWIDDGYAGPMIERNLARHLSWRSLPRVGHDLVLGLNGPAREPWTLFVAPGRSQTSTPFGTYWLDPASDSVAAQGALGNRGRAQAALPIPLDLGLVGTTSYWQALVGTPPRWSNLEPTTFLGP